MATTLGVLVAGGAGTRLRLGYPKAQVELQGLTLLERALRTLTVPCDEIVVAFPAAGPGAGESGRDRRSLLYTHAASRRPLPDSPGPGPAPEGGGSGSRDAACVYSKERPPVPPPPGARPPRVVADAEGPAGPLAGMVAGLAACAFERAIVLGVDFPFMTPAFLAALLDRLGDHDAVVPAPRGIAQPLAAAYAPRAAEILAARHAAGEGAPSRALAALRVLRIDDAELARMPGGPDVLFNLNTPADLAEAERRMAARTGGR